MSGLTTLVHRAYPSRQKEFCSGRKAIHVWRGYYCNPSRSEEAPYVAEEANWVFDVLNYLDGGDDVKRTSPKLAGEVVPVEVNGNMGQTSHKAISVTVNRQDVASEGV